MLRSVAMGAALVLWGWTWAHAEQEAPQPALRGTWSFDLEAGVRVQIWEDYRGVLFAPGFWYEMPQGLRIGLFAPVNLRTSAGGRQGVFGSIGIEPRLQLPISSFVSVEAGFGIAAETEAKVHGIFSYGAGVNFNDIACVRVTHERFELDGMGSDSLEDGRATTNSLDLVFTGESGRAIAVAGAALMVLLYAVTAQ